MAKSYLKARPRTAPRRETRAIFGDAIALVPQDPMTALNPAGASRRN